MSTDTDRAAGPHAKSGDFFDGEELAAVRSGIASFVRERVRRADADGVVVGLSGGVDSTLSAVLAVEALGSDRVLGLSLPRNKIDRPDATEARTIAEALGIEFREVTLRSVVDEFEDAVGNALAPAADGHGGGEPSLTAGNRDPAELALGNAAARVRMACLYYAANTRSRLVLGTANRTELLTGYFTKHGDGGADLFPLGGLYKTEVRALAHRVGVPRRIVAKPSTAGFWAGQTDADELGSRYADIDVLLHRIVDEGLRLEPAIEDLAIDREVATELLARCADTHHKRHTPPVYRVGDRPDGSERFPGSGGDRGGMPTGDRPAGPPADGRLDVPVASRQDGSASTLSETLAACDRPVDRDTVLTAVADERRRAVLAVLYRRCETTVPTLALAVAARERDQPRSAVPSEDVERLSTALLHVHLPKLAGADLVECDDDRRAVRLTGLARRIRPVVGPLLA